MSNVRPYLNIPGLHRTVLSNVLLVVVLIGSPFAKAESVPKSRGSYETARELQRGYIDRLDLKNQSAEAAVRMMLAQGFRCRIQIAEELVPMEDAMWDCVKEPSGYETSCEELEVIMPFRGPVAWTTHQALLVRLDEIAVRRPPGFFAGNCRLTTFPGGRRGPTWIRATPPPHP